MTVRKVADVQEEELEEYEPFWSKQYSQEFLYVKMTSRLNNSSSEKQNTMVHFHKVLSGFLIVLKLVSYIHSNINSAYSLSKDDNAGFLGVQSRWKSTRLNYLFSITISENAS